MIHEFIRKERKKMLKVVEGKDLKGTIKDISEKSFYGESGRKTEEEYKQLLIDSQQYFEGIESGAISPDDNYFIYAPDYYLTRGYAKDIAVITNNKISTVNARLLYIENPIKVTPYEDGYIYASSDGRHRYTVAQKYNLKLLVDVLPADKIDTYNTKTEQKKVSILNNLNKIKHFFNL